MRVPILIGGLMLLKAMRPESLEKVLAGEAKWTEVQEALGLTSDLRGAGHTERQISEAWLLCFQDQKTPEFWQEYLKNEYHNVTANYGSSTLRNLYDSYIGAISIDGLA